MSAEYAECNTVIALTTEGMLTILEYSQLTRVNAGIAVFTEWERVAMLDPERALKIPGPADQVETAKDIGKPIWDLSINLGFSSKLGKDKYGNFYLISSVGINRTLEFQRIIYNMHEITKDEAYYKIRKNMDESQIKPIRNELIHGNYHSIFTISDLVQLLHSCGFQKNLLRYVTINGAEEIGQLLLAHDVFKRIRDGETYTDEHREFLTKLMYNKRLKLYDTSPVSSLPKYIWDDDKNHKDITSVWRLITKMMKVEDGNIRPDGTTLLYNITPHIELPRNYRVSVLTWKNCPAKVGDIIEYVNMGSSGFCMRIVASEDNISKETRLKRIYG